MLEFHVKSVTSKQNQRVVFRCTSEPSIRTKFQLSLLNKLIKKLLLYVCESDNCLKCNECEFVTENKSDLDTHAALKHELQKVKTKKHINKPWKCPICNLQCETYEQSVIHSSICNYGTLRQSNQLNPRSPTILSPHFPTGQMFHPRSPHFSPPRFPRGQMFL